MKEPKQLVLPCCEKYFSEEGNPQPDGVTTGRFSSQDPNESMPPKGKVDSLDNIAVVTKESWMDDKDVLLALEGEILKRQ